MNDAKEFWNEKFSRAGYLYGTKPNAYIKEKSVHLPDGSDILCLAEGEGRNAVYLASCGHKVATLDASDIAIEKQQKLAQQCGHSIYSHLIDLNDWEPEKNTQNAIVMSYLHLPKPLLKKTLKNIETALKPNGLFVGEFFSKDQMNYTSGGPRVIDILYDKVDFETFMQGLSLEVLELEKKIVELDEGVGHQGEASVIRVMLKKI
jgi:SAM-dependent methyltransferase